jgi:hypothetical protein
VSKIAAYALFDMDKMKKAFLYKIIFVKGIRSFNATLTEDHSNQVKSDYAPGIALDFKVIHGLTNESKSIYQILYFLRKK